MMQIHPVTLAPSEKVNDRLSKYIEIRSAGRSMSGKTMDGVAGKGFDPVRAAKSMGLPVAGRTLLFDSDLVLAAFRDFWQHEFRSNGKTVAESADPVAANLTELEIEVLKATQCAWTSLYEVAGFDADFSKVLLRDLLDPAHEEVWLTDIQLAKSLSFPTLPPVLFMLNVRTTEVNKNSGFFFPFEAEYAPGLLQAYRQKMKRIPPSDLSRERFVFFFKKFRQIGSEGNLDISWAPPALQE
jgi:hypothetical protein